MLGRRTVIQIGTTPPTPGSAHDVGRAADSDADAQVPTSCTPDGRWHWDGAQWVELRPTRRWPSALRAPRRAWLAAIVALWILTWWQPFVATTGTRERVGVAIFAAACLCTVAFGRVLGIRGHRDLIAGAALQGVVLLGVSSIVAIGVAVAVASGIGAFVPGLEGVVVFGFIFIIALGLVGFFFLWLLLWIGASATRSTRRRTARAH